MGGTGRVIGAEGSLIDHRGPETLELEVRQG